MSYTAVFLSRPTAVGPTVPCVCVLADTDRLGEAEDCAGAVAFLSSDDASYMTGETIVIAGGWQSRL